MENKKFIGIGFIALTGVLSIVACVLAGRIGQDPSYHQFSDIRTLLLVPHFWNVVSNFPFVLVGAIGFWRVRNLSTKNFNIEYENILAYKILFFSTSLVGFGSAYYHIDPNNFTLVWDRLPMTLAFMALYSVILGEFISTQLGKRSLIPLLVFGLFSVMYWHITEQNGVGDLRLYALVQFFPIVTIPIILICFTSTFVGTKPYWYLIASYVLAKIFEHFDGPIFEYLKLLSGHSIKHVAPAIGLYFLLKSYEKQRI